MTQDELKTLVGQAALAYVQPNTIVGVGTGSTVNKFIDALASMKTQIKGAVSSSEASTVRLKALGIPVFDSNEVPELAVYIDGADEIDHHGYMVKGGGAALTREKIVAAQSKQFVCIVDESKWVPVLGISRYQWKSFRWLHSVSRQRSRKWADTQRSACAMANRWSPIMANTSWT